MKNKSVQNDTKQRTSGLSRGAHQCRVLGDVKAEKMMYGTIIDTCISSIYAKTPGRGKTDTLTLPFNSQTVKTSRHFRHLQHIRELKTAKSWFKGISCSEPGSQLTLDK